MTKADLETILNNLSPAELQELQAAARARAKASKKVLDPKVLETMQELVRVQGFRQVQLAFTAVRKDHVVKVKAERAAKAAKKTDKPTKEKAPKKTKG